LRLMSSGTGTENSTWTSCPGPRGTTDPAGSLSGSVAVAACLVFYAFL
jgi:hypothetical protein